MNIVEIYSHHVLLDRITTGGTVLDLGFGRGLFSRALTAFVPVNIVGVEANPGLYPPEGLPPGMNVVNRAVVPDGTQGDTVDLFVGKNSEASSVINRGRTVLPASIQVPVLSFADALASCHVPVVELVKMDIEGAEVEILRQARVSDLQRVKQITIEFHDFLGLHTKREIRRVLRRLSDAEFVVVKFPTLSYSDVLCLNVNLLGFSLLERWQAKYVIRSSVRLKNLFGRLGRRRSR